MTTPDACPIAIRVVIDEAAYAKPSVKVAAERIRKWINRELGQGAQIATIVTVSSGEARAGAGGRDL